jgi:hypothetical protein
MNDYVVTNLFNEYNDEINIELERLDEYLKGREDDDVVTKNFKNARAEHAIGMHIDKEGNAFLHDGMRKHKRAMPFSMNTLVDFLITVDRITKYNVVV